MRKSLVIGVLAVVAAGAAAVVFAPVYVQRRAIGEAAERGITLSIEHTRLAASGIQFEGVGATSARTPNAKVTNAEIDASWDGSHVTMNGGEVTLDGVIAPPALAALEKPVPTNAPGTVHVQNTHVVWSHFAGDAQIEIANLVGDVSLAPHLGDAYDLQGMASLKSGAIAVGPFLTHVSRDLGGEHFRTQLDPTDPNANVFAFDRSGDTTRFEWTVKARRPSQLGLPLDAVGIGAVPGDPVLDFHVVDSVTRPASGVGVASGLVSLATQPITVPQLPTPVAVTAELTWKGDPASDMPVSGGKAKAGPFEAAITGTVRRPVHGVAVDLSLTSNPVPCSQFASDPLAIAKQMAGGDLGSALVGALGSSGAMKTAITGSVTVSGKVVFDSGNPAASRVSFSPSNSCGMSVSFGSPR